MRRGHGIEAARRTAGWGRRRAAVTAVLLISAIAPSAAGWGAHGHRLISELALRGFDDSGPEWLRDPEVRRRVAHQSNEVDRWRGWSVSVLGHENKPDHYLDVELLEQFGLTLETIPPLRNEYLRALMIAKHEHPERVDPYDAAKDAERSHEWPGFVLHAVAEHYAKLQACFHQERILSQMGEPRRAFQLQQARENAIYHMGMLSHFVGDIAQPLHTTRHFNGWSGPNPHGYTTSDKFHAYIDSGVVDKHDIKVEDVRPLVRHGASLNAMDPWDDVLAYFRRSFAEVEPLYELEKRGQLDGDAGKAMISARLADAAGMLSAMYQSAYSSSSPNAQQSAAWIRFDDLDRGQRPAASGPSARP